GRVVAFDNDLEPSVLNGVVGPDDFDTIRAADTSPGTNREPGRCGSGTPAGNRAVGTDLEGEVRQAERAGCVLDVHHDAVDTAAVARERGQRSGRAAAELQGCLVDRDRRVVRGINRRIIAVKLRLVVEDLTADDRSGDHVDRVAKIDTVTDLSLIQVFKLIPIPGNRSADHDGNRPQHDVRALAHKLQVKATGHTVSDKLNIKGRGRTGTHSVNDAGVIDDMNPRIRRLNGDVHGDVGHRVLDGA